MDITAYLKNSAADVNRMLEERYGSPQTLLSGAANHLLFAGGKRLRPTLFRLVTEAISPDSSLDLMPAGLALEVTHCFTLIHDDIMDKDQYRRGKETVHKIWGEATGILAGDVLYARAFDLICQAGAPESAQVRAIKMLSLACIEICEGQQMDMSFESRDDVTRAEYLTMVEKKTGVLYGAAAGIGALCAGGSDPQISALIEYGKRIGAGFQIRDDVIDLVVPSEQSGKDQASDIREGKQTLLAIFARERGIDLRPYRRSLSVDEINDLITLLTREQVITDVTQEAERHVSAGIALLDCLSDSDEKKRLIQLAEYCISRSS